MDKLVRRYLDYSLQGEIDRRLMAQLTMLDADEAALYVDCGCHAGYNTLRLSQRIGTQRIIGVDFNERILGDARERGLAGVRCDVNKSLPFRECSVNVITALDVIEHLVETRTFIRELYRVLTPGGYLVLDTPNLASWHNVLALVIGIQPFSGPNITTMLDAELDVVRRIHRAAHQAPEEGEIVDENERELRRHIVVLAYRSLIKLLKHEGFVVEQAQGFGYLPFPPFLAWLLSSLDPVHAHHMLIKARKPN
jgi:ubiquinone/menaquinone biosynthesis C-methylase UbiE